MLFRSDEKNTQHALYDDPIASSQLPQLPEDAVLKCEQAISVSCATESSSESAIYSEDASPVLDAQPVTHWGSHKGLILSAAVCDAQGVQKDVFEWGEVLKILIKVHIPKDISREHLSIAFSIKDLKGTDLIVSTTHDFERRRLPDKERFSVSFQFANPLVTGKYLLVAAVENRQYRDIHYYEYVEGSHYFAVLDNERLFGIFQPPIAQQILV